MAVTWQDVIDLGEKHSRTMPEISSFDIWVTTYSLRVSPNTLLGVVLMQAVDVRGDVYTVSEHHIAHWPNLEYSAVSAWDERDSSGFTRYSRITWFDRWMKRNKRLGMTREAFTQALSTYGTEHAKELMELCR